MSSRRIEEFEQMASESIEILIEANDQASAKVERSAQNVEASIKRVKDVGGKAKASTEFIGTLANSLGGTQLGGFASELAGLTERITAFSEVSAAGSAGAFAFKAGLAGVVAVGAFQAGRAIGDIVFQTERWADELKRGADEAERMQQQLNKIQGKQFSEKREDLGLIRGDAEREAATKAEADRLVAEAEAMDRRINLAKASIEDRKLFNEGAGKFNRNSAEILKQEEAQLQIVRDRRQALLDEAKALREGFSERQKMIAATKAENAKADQSDSFVQGLREQVAFAKATDEERRRMEAARNTNSPEAQAEAEMLLKELELEKEKAKVVAQAEADKEIARRKAEMAAEAEERRIENIREKEAARIQQERERIDTIANGIAANGLPQLQAVQSRLLTRGSSNQDQERNKQIAENTKQMLTAQLDATELQRAMLAAIQQNKFQIAVIN